MEGFMKTFDYIILGHQNPDVDSIVSGYLLEQYLNRCGYVSKFMIPDSVIDEENLRVCRKYDLDPMEFQGSLPDLKNQKYILVDHHERDVVGEVVAVLDHHPTSKDIVLPYYRNERFSSTACMIVEDNENSFTKEEIELAVLATMIDTVSFHSSKTVDRDISWVERMVEKYQFDFSKLYDDGLCLTDISNPTSFLTHGLKEYHFGDKNVAASYVSLLYPEQISERLSSVFPLLQNYVSDHDLELFAFIINDMTEFQSSVYYVTSSDVVKRDFDHFVSRGNEIIPEIEKKLLKK